MRHKQIYQQESFLGIVAFLGTLAVLLGPCTEKQVQEAEDKRLQKATIIHHHTQTNDNNSSVMQLWLDTDGNKKTVESVCEIPMDVIHPWTTNDVKKILPVNAKRSMWELQKLGRISSVERP